MATCLFRLRQLLIISGLCVSVYFLLSTLKVGYPTPDDASFLSRAERYKEEIVDENPIKVKSLHSDRDRDHQASSGGSKPSEDLLKNQKCNIPKLDINGSEVIHFFTKHAPLECQKSGKIEDNWVFINDEGVIRFTEKRAKAKCKIQYFERIDDNKNRYEEPVEIFDGDKMNGSDYATVSCIQGFQKWNSLLWDVNDVAEVHERARKMRRAEETNAEKKAYNVYFLGFDSLSQMSFRRKLPKTVDFLENTLGSVVLNGYNIVGDGTPQAFIPILTAQTETELPLTRKRYKKANYVDDVYPFIWKNFSDQGYVTMYAEDAFNIGTFTYRLKGFRKQPTDHYTRTLFEEVEKLNDRNCIGSIPLHRMWLQNGRQFMTKYNDVPRFCLMHQSLLSHDDINLVDVEDVDLSAHLKHMNELGMFDDSIVIVMADHGHRFAKLRETHQGQLEERMPFFSIALPKELRETEKGKLMERNLRENAEKLTSPFDIHASLLDILNLSATSSDDFHRMQDASQKRSLSVFRPIPTDRTCSQAGIEPHWCTCLSWKNALDTEEDRKLTKRIANAVVREINKEIAVEKELCAPLKLAKIIDAKKLLPDEGLLAYKNVKDADGFVPDLSGSTKAAFAHYQLKIQTTPGVAIYEITLFYSILEDTVELDFGAMSHVNKFGDTPHCIIDKNYYLATFCVCYDRI
ncbi:hypothetical protein B9Z55_012303 [Caenorhabditis nigoni]|uniref:Uncharacterized protein n=1 Tax=Caenorhabditis nigoni TaxID=1611254 RepID=A0A2G5TWJ6_9PELO|nr:hypothetical protein B9Z55_012303 [Caenorhabditis nigoni]